MRIHCIHLQPFGPLPEVNFQPSMLSIIYDGNEAGKTALVDALVQLVFSKSSFPGADRFGNAAGKVELEFNGTRYSLPGKRTLAKLLGWEQSLSQFLRLLCIRAGELDLAARSEKFSQLMDALTAALGEAEVSPQRVIARVQEAACLTSTGNWSDEQPHRQASEIQQTTKRLAQLENALDTAFATEEKDKQLATKRQELTQLDQQLKQINEQISQIEQQMEAHRYHQANAYYQQWHRLQSEIEQNYARYRRQDLEAWKEYEQHLQSKEKSLAKTKEEELRLAQEQKKLHEQLTDRRTELQLQQHELERANENKQTVDEQIRAERRNLSEQTTSLVAELTKFRQAEQSLRQRELWARLMPWAAGAGFLVCAACLAVAMLKSTLWGMIGLAIFLLLTLLCLWVYRRWHYEVETLRQLEATVQQQVSQIGLPWKGIEQVEPTWRSYQAEKEKYLEEKSRVAAQRQQQCAETVARLAADVQNLHHQVDQLTKELVQTQQERHNLEKELEELTKQIQQIRQRCGLPDRQDLEQKVSQREQLEAKQAQTKASLSTLTGRDDPEGWLAWLDQTSQKLPPDWRKTPDGLPSIEELQKQLDQLRQDRNRLQQDRESLHQEAEKLRTGCNELRAKLHPLGVSDAIQVFLAIQEAQEKLKHWVKQRLAALLAIQVLEKLQQSYVTALQEPLAQAGSIFQQITQRYEALRYDRPTGRFYAVESTGQEFEEEKLSSGARAQLLFAVRLALVQRLLPEPGFLILDDPFLTYAPDRKERAVNYLGQLVQQGWQVLYLTVDPLSRDLLQRIADSPVKTIADLVTSLQRAQTT
ncbi:MAG: AAA family ATPase [Thermoguttaceae bacterium]|nr:AAA family ATPase [Thermoguttaceae bacterium]MDW8037483.1 AAA family ATPase [Thermoguttaceae bacterium]